MLGKLLHPEVRELIISGDDQTLREVLNRWSPADVVELLDEFNDDEDLAAVKMMAGPQRARVFEYLDRRSQKCLLATLPPESVRSLLTDIADDDRTAILEELSEEDRERLLGLLSDEQRAIAESLLQYPENSVGRIMTPHFVAIRPHWTVQHVLDHIRQHGQDSETLNMVYIVDDDHHLIDDLRIRKILLAKPSQYLSEILDYNFAALNVMDPKRDAV